MGPAQVVETVVYQLEEVTSPGEPQQSNRLMPDTQNQACVCADVAGISWRQVENIYLNVIQNACQCFMLMLLAGA